MKQLTRIAALLALTAGLTAAPTFDSAQAQEGPAETASAKMPSESGGTKKVAQPDDEAAKASKKFAEEKKQLAGAIEAILANSDVSRGTVGIHVVDIESDQVLYSQGADEPMNPASNMKLITSAAALDKFGPHHTFETKLLAKKVDEKGTVRGSLYVRGEGEAFLLYEDFLDWAGKLRQKGVKKIEGDIVIDDTAFKGDYLPPGFEQKKEDASYRSPIGAVSVNFNAVTAVVEPADKAGKKPHCRLVPPNDHVQIVNKATTYSGRRRRIHVASKPTDDGGTKLIITGKIGHKARPLHDRKRIDNPPKFAASVLASALKMVGIEFDGEFKTGETPEAADVLVSHRSQPLSYIILAMNKWSNNFMAEQLLRTLGVTDKKASTWKASRKVAVEFLTEAGVETDKLTIHNGSGLYAGNLVSPEQFVTLLDYMSEHRSAPEYLSSLSIAGADGTLANRMDDAPTAGNVRGKTGTLNEVSALSGYLRTKSGRFVAFSILFNDPPRRAWHYRPVQDRIVEEIAGFDE